MEPIARAMTLELPEPDFTELPHSPLELVVCQIRFERRLAASDSSTARAIHEALGSTADGYPQVEPAGTATLSVIAAPGQQPPGVSEAMLSGWRFVSRDRRWIATVMPDHASLETTAYTTFAKDFEPRLARLIDAVAEHVQPTFEQRVGLRYVDRITELQLKSLAEWEPYLRPQMLGLVLHPELGPGVRAMQHQTILHLDEDLRCGLRHGPLVNDDTGVVDFVLDYDVFRERGQVFDAAGIKDAASQMNRWAQQLFEATITDELLQRLRG